MKVGALLKKAKKCETDGQAHDFLLDEFIPLFEGFSKLKKLHLCNPDFAKEDSGTFVRVEFNHVISNNYITVIRPEIRSEKMVIYVATNRMNDGLGLASQDYEVVNDMEEVIEGTLGDNVLSMVKKAIAFAVSQHAQLIEEVGVSRNLALSVAKKSW